MDKRNSATLRRTQGYLNSTEMANELGINKYTFHYWTAHGLIPRPSITFTGKRRYYCEKDVATIREIVEGNNES